MFNKFFDVEEFDYELEKKKFVDNMNFLKSMSVQEITLYKKWEEFNKDSYAMLQKASKFDILENLGSTYQQQLDKSSKHFCAPQHQGKEWSRTFISQLGCN